MPFVARKVEPRYLCRGHVPSGAASRDWPVGAELEAAANGALTASLKQLGSLLVAAEDIFAELTTELAGIAERSGRLRIRLDNIEERLAHQDPKKIPVPESDICTFAQRTEHFSLSRVPEKCLFTLDTRPKALKQLYEKAAAAAVRSLDSIRRDAVDAATGISSLEMFMCTPIMSKRIKRDQSLDIEKRVPKAIEDLRRWTSAEALGDVTVAPDCTSRILADTGDDSQPVDHKLPSPEEQLQAIALKFPAEIVKVDVSGRGFRRMSMRRRSMHNQGQDNQDQTVRRRSRPRRSRGKRRNTIAGTDQKEIRQAIGGETTEPEEAHASTSKRTHRSASTDILGSGGSKKDTSTEKKSHFNTLKAWGRSRLKLISPKSSQQNHMDQNESSSTLTSLEHRLSKHLQTTSPEDEICSADDNGTYETLTVSHLHERVSSTSSSSCSSHPKQQQLQAKQDPKKDRLSQISSSTVKQSSVKLRESAAERRERRKARADEPPHSSSGNWSASSESGRASIGSETTTTTHPPKSTTTASIGTSSTSLSHVRRLKNRDTSASSSVTSEGTLTPDIIQDINAVPFSDDGETSSVYSCDTEGYYTSFHMDSGLKTLREEEPQQTAQPQSPLTRTNEVQSDPTSPVAENEYELYGRGSTSTTTSSAGTVCTTLMAPPPPERKSSLTVVAVVHGGQKKNGGESPDSGHNTSSSPVESASSPACTGRSCSEFEYSESSDLEGCERIERIRSKTAINTSRIPSMCVITPPGSDDEHKDQSRKDQKQAKKDRPTSAKGDVLMSATVGTSKMEVINGQDKNLYATVQTVVSPTAHQTPDKGPVQQGQPTKISPLSAALGKLRGVLPGRKHQQKTNSTQDVGGYSHNPQPDSGDYVTIADVRNNNSKQRTPEAGITTTPTTVRSNNVTYANADIFRRDAEYVCLSELPKKQDSSLERRRQGARVTLDSEGKVVYSSDSLKRRKGAHTTFIPGPFVKEGTSSPAASPLLRRAQVTPRAVQKTGPDTTDSKTTETTSAQSGKVIIRAAKSPERAASPDYVRTPATVVGPTPPAANSQQQQQQQQQRQLRHGAYVNVQGGNEEEKTLLAIQPNEPVSTSACPQQQLQKHHQHPPPYVGPPQVQKLPEDYPYQTIYDNRSLQHTNLQSQMRQNLNNQQHHQHHHHHHNPEFQNYHYHHHQQRQVYPQMIDPYQQLIYEKNNLLHHQRQQPYSNYAENQKIYAQQMHDKTQQQFYTLPNRRPNREITSEPPRSITPDITRGLARAGPLSAMHMMARQGQKSNSTEKLVPHHHGQFGHECQMDLNRRNLEQFEARCQLAAQHQQRQAPVDVKNRFASPVGLSALGYRLFATPVQEGLKNVSISPIGPEHANGFKSSTPTSGRATPTVAERLALQSQRCASPNPALIQYHASLAERSDSGRSTPTNNANVLLSPIKSTMSNEELFAAIHKSKRRLNIRDDPESLSPAGSLTSLTKNQQVIGTRHSWSPESQKTPEIPKSVLVPSATSRMDFKRLLLQQSIKNGPMRVSATEQLKMSRQQCQEGLQQQSAPSASPKPSQQSPLTKVLSPRSAWRFHTPRTDVLSSTIIEDSAAEEKAMKPSPDTPLPTARIPLSTNVKRQLDLTSNDTMKELEAVKNVINDTKTQRTLEKSEKELENRLQLIDEAARDPKPTESLDNPIKAIENRRMTNQQLRAQFLAANSNSTGPLTTASHKDLFNRRFRARSESPQQNNNQRTVTCTSTAASPTPPLGNAAVVTRSPSAPALETAL